jgi:hypothetical protein
MMTCSVVRVRRRAGAPGRHAMAPPGRLGARCTAERGRKRRAEHENAHVIQNRAHEPWRDLPALPRCQVARAVATERQDATNRARQGKSASRRFGCSNRPARAWRWIHRAGALARMCTNHFAVNLAIAREIRDGVTATALYVAPAARERVMRAAASALYAFRRAAAFPAPPVRGLRRIPAVCHLSHRLLAAPASTTAAAADAIKHPTAGAAGVLPRSTTKAPPTMDTAPAAAAAGAGAGAGSAAPASASAAAAAARPSHHKGEGVGGGGGGSACWERTSHAAATTTLAPPVW